VGEYELFGICSNKVGFGLVICARALGASRNILFIIDFVDSLQNF
jgi:hypothetical protein